MVQAIWWIHKLIKRFSSIERSQQLCVDETKIFWAVINNSRESFYCIIKMICRVFCQIHTFQAALSMSSFIKFLFCRVNDEVGFKVFKWNSTNNSTVSKMCDFLFTAAKISFRKFLRRSDFGDCVEVTVWYFKLCESDNKRIIWNEIK